VYVHTFCSFIIMSAVNSLVPARFLTLTAHLVIVITIFWLVVALSVTLGLFFIELMGFFSGVSMFNSSSLTPALCNKSTLNLLASAAHASASIALLFFLFEQWSCAIYWWIFAFCSASVCLSFFVFQQWECWTYWFVFAFCSALPAVVEILLFIAVFGLKKKPL
ncbi:hypothetical protein Z043_125052, partial [Scleropages formosus]